MVRRHNRDGRRLAISFARITLSIAVGILLVRVRLIWAVVPARGDPSARLGTERIVLRIPRADPITILIVVVGDSVLRLARPGPAQRYNFRAISGIVGNF